MAEKRNLVALPIASLDREGRAPPPARVREWTLLVSVCDDRETFLGRRDDVHRLAEVVKEGLDQETALVLGFAADSFLVEDKA